MDKSGSAADPFEEFRRKKKAEAAVTAPTPQVGSAPVREDGRPRGFSTHRHDFDQPHTEGGAPVPPEAAAPADRPKGFVSTRMTDPPQTPDASTPPRPKGFKHHRLTDDSPGSA